MSIIIKCKMCGGDLDIQPGTSTAECLYCGTLQTIPNIDNEKRANLFDRANHYRRNNDFDKALSIYEQLVSENNTDAEAHWSIVLCKYGIEYVEDPRTHRRIPTVNRTQYSSIFNDPDYLTALKCADSQQYAIYKEEAQVIDHIQNGILEISRKEAPFDIFICYKETDNRGGRTQDSVIAYDLYEELINKGYRVFFARVTLEDKLGTAYEPYIFAALNSAKIMLVIGTNIENLNAVWVKNEWNRYLALMSQDRNKVLIPIYKDMDPYDLPAEFAHLQAQDMGKLAAKQDIMRGIDKILSTESNNKTPNGVQTASATIESLLQRVEQFLDLKQWENAAEYCNRILDSKPDCAMAYFYMYITEAKANDYNEIIASRCDPSKNTNFTSALKYANPEEKEQFKTILTEYEEAHRTERAKKAKRNFLIKIVSAVLAVLILCVGGFFTYKYICRKNELQKKEVELQQSYSQAEALYNEKNYNDAKILYDSLGTYNDSVSKAFRCGFESDKAGFTINKLSSFEKYVDDENTHDEAVDFLVVKANELIKKMQEYQNSNSEYVKGIGEIINVLESIRNNAINCLHVAGYDDKSPEICEVKYQLVMKSYDEKGNLGTLYPIQKEDLEYLSSINYKDSSDILSLSKIPRATISFNKNSYKKTEGFDAEFKIFNITSGYILATFPDRTNEKYTLSSSDINYGGGSCGWCYTEPSKGVTGILTYEIYTDDGQLVGTASCQITD